MNKHIKTWLLITSVLFRRFSLSIILILLVTTVNAQDIEQVIKAPVMATNGGVSFSQIGAFSPDSNTTITPYSYFVSGNINTSLFGVVSLPLSFAYSNSQVTTQTPHPFNRFTISPSYKWLTVHMGYSSMSFSPYTLSGHEFLGGGIDVAPTESFKVSALYGRFKKAVNPDSLGSVPVYNRMGGGLKIDYLNKHIDVGVNIFKAKDDLQSVNYQGFDSAFVKPQDNIAGGVSLKLKLIKSLMITADYGISALNQDISGQDSLPRGFSDNVVSQSSDLAVYHAFRGSISQSSNIGSIGASYERVTPNYRTLGAYYFNNDFENITADFSTSLKHWLTIAMNVGYQRDNLEKQKVNTSSRLIYSINASSMLTKKLGIAAAYSNISSYVHIRDIYNELEQTNEFQNLDTLSFTQINLTESVNLNYNIQATKHRRQNINIGFAYQEASEEQADDERYKGNQIYNSTLSYQFSMIPERLNISTAINYNQNRMPTMEMHITSYNLSIQKVFFEQVKAALISTYSNSFNNESNLADIINIRVTGGYTLQKRHNVNLSVAMVNNKSIQGTSTQYSANLAYSYIFNFQVKRDNKKLGFEGNF